MITDRNNYFNINTLEDTAALMQSTDYRDRFRAEYHQVRIRYYKLRAMVEQMDKGKLDFKLACPYDVLMDQLTYMQRYMLILEHRAELEDIRL